MYGVGWWWSKKRESERAHIRVLESVTTFAAAEKLVREANVTTHAANGLKVHHGWCEWERKMQNLEEREIDKSEAEDREKERVFI